MVKWPLLSDKAPPTKVESDFNSWTVTMDTASLVWESRTVPDTSRFCAKPTTVVIANSASNSNFFILLLYLLQY